MSPRIPDINAKPRKSREEIRRRSEKPSSLTNRIDLFANGNGFVRLCRWTCSRRGKLLWLLSTATEIVPGSDENRKELMLCVLIGPTRKLPFNNPVAQLRCWHQKESAHHCLTPLRNNRHRRRFSPSAITQKCFSWKGSGFYFQRSIAGKKRRNDENRPRSLCNSSFFMQLWQSGEKLASIKAWWSRNYSLGSPF